MEEGGSTFKTVTSTRQVPSTKVVKVPVQTKKVVNTTKRVKVRVKKFVEVDDVEDVEEKYIAMEKQTATREKITWVKKVVEEEVKVTKPVVKTRIVKKPVIKIVERTVWETVEVPTTKKVQKEAFILKEVKKVKTIEVEEYEDIELQPKPVGILQDVDEKDTGEIVPGTANRSMGTKVYMPGEFIEEIGKNIDDVPLDPEHLPTPLSPNHGYLLSKKARASPGDELKKSADGMDQDGDDDDGDGVDPLAISFSADGDIYTLDDEDDAADCLKQIKNALDLGDQDAEQVCRQHDTQENGCLDKRHFSMVLEALGFTCSDGLVSKIFDSFDVDDDGDISYSQFLDSISDSDQKQKKGGKRKRRSSSSRKRTPRKRSRR